MLVYQVWLGDEPPNHIKRYMESVRENSPNYFLDTEERYPGLPYYVQSNLMRLEMAAKTPDLFYLDSDVEMFSFPTFDKEGPYVGTCEASGGPHVALFYVNGVTERFKLTLDFYKAVYEVQPFLNFAFFHTANRIDERTYKHHYYTHPAPKWGSED